MIYGTHTTHLRCCCCCCCVVCDHILYWQCYVYTWAANASVCVRWIDCACWRKSTLKLHIHNIRCSVVYLALNWTLRRSFFASKTIELRVLAAHGINNSSSFGHRIHILLPKCYPVIRLLHSFCCDWWFLVAINIAIRFVVAVCIFNCFAHVHSCHMEYQK